MTEGFRDKFKYYKKKIVPPDLKTVINFNSENPDFFCKEYIKLISPVNLNQEKIFGIKPPSQWKVYEFFNKPGLIFIKNPFEAVGQRYWIIRCLQYFTKKPCKLNIDAHGILKPYEDWWEFCQRNKCTEEGINTLKKLRWATFGYHHNWDTKEYSENAKCEFPADLKYLCSYLAQALNFHNFNAEAAIVNMYHFNSSLSGHTDHSEINVEAPLFSLSFGQSAIFLIGGKSIEDYTLPILLESGDIIIMSGESRLCYHGVPKIVPAQSFPWREIEENLNENSGGEYFSSEVMEKLVDHNEWKPFENYVKKARINVNVRQVLFPGQNGLDS